ncbi:MAG: class I SAM-dependent methyltransferase [Rubrivivax sp.]|nr:class I SAM-dependent methyltransferase [Rubrivivax sp.]
MQDQKTLSRAQVEAFYHDHFVDAQVRHFAALVLPRLPAPRAVVDIGGGCGFFAQGVQAASGVHVRVLDTDPTSVQTCLAKGVDAIVGDALQPQVQGDEDVVCFNLVLHHLVGHDEATTRSLQARALTCWRERARLLFVNEYIYESYVPGVAGRLIFAITRSRILSSLAAAVSRFVPSLRANTFGVGVRFRDHAGWRRMFSELGYEVLGVVQGEDEPVSPARRLLLIRSIRRDSFVLAATPARANGVRGA